MTPLDASRGPAPPANERPAAPAATTRTAPAIPFAALLALGASRAPHGASLANSLFTGFKGPTGPRAPRRAPMKPGGKPAAEASRAVGATDPRAKQEHALASARVSHHARADEDDPLDPIHRQRASLAPPEAMLPFVPSPIQQAAALVQAHAQASLEQLLPALVKRVSWSGDGRRGAMRLELGAGALAGATLFVQANDGRVSVRLEVAPGMHAEAWRARIHERLTSRGLDVEYVEVT